VSKCIDDQTQITEAVVQRECGKRLAVQRLRAYLRLQTHQLATDTVMHVTNDTASLLKDGTATQDLVALGKAGGKLGLACL
jgi:hypothetical protein